MLEMLKSVPTPLKVVAVIGVAVILYSAIFGGISTVWAKHIANRALRGIASQISDIDAETEKSAAHEATIQAMAARAAELQKEIDGLNAEQDRLRAELGKAHARSTAADAERERVRADAAARPKVETLEQARDSLNRYLGGQR